jgi:hypothetical protein
MMTPLEEFWDWFVLNAEEVRRAYQEGDSEWLNDQLSRWLQSYAEGLHWEIGPYHHDADTLVISPGTRANLPITRRLVAAAPQIPGWRFEHAKPKKKVSKLAIRLDNARYPAEDWTYRLTAYNEGEFVDIEVFISTGAPFDDSRGRLLCELVVETLLGEELRLERVGMITHQRVADPAGIPRVTSIRHLYDHLKSALRANL